MLIMKSNDMIPPRLVAVDLDGTLLNSDHRLSERTIASMRRLEDAGIPVVISTGRSYEGMMHFKNDIGLKNPVICYNGAVIADGGSDRILHQWLLSADIARSALDYARERNIHLQFFQDGELYFERRREESAYYEASTGLTGHVTDFDSWENLEVTKALMVLPPSRESGEFPELHEAKAHFESLFGEKLYCALSKPFYLEFINGRGSKGNALLQVCRDMGIRAEEIAAFGDGFNDLEMLEVAGMSVAMSNAPDGVKNACSHITELNNDEDGVADFVERYFLA
jgi:Cof subfamily protein (haloacid dehalogenase superfamily)